jgi:hypothetical protein
VFAGLLALSYYAGPARYSADYYLEQKISWWWRVAEVRRPVPAVAAPAPEAAVPVPPGAVPAQHTPQAGQPRTATSSRS